MTRPLRVGIHGFGRMGRLALRAGWERDDLEFVAINEPAAEASTMAHLTEFDSVQGRFDHECAGADDKITIGGRELAFANTSDPRETRWMELGVDLVLECSGAHRTTPSLQGHFETGARRVLVSAPVKDGPPNIVVGVNHESFDLAQHPIVTAASCTTNCLAPVVRVIHDTIGIERGLVTTIHNPTNTQSVHDAPHADPRRARAAQLSLIPTSTNSASAVTLIIPELKGRLDSVAVRVPVMNASITDCVFQLSRSTTVEEVNDALRAAASEGPLVGILGIEDKPLVSADYAGDSRSGIVDALSTRVTDRRLLKLLVWYDNEWGYANRLVELAGLIARAGITD